MASESTIARLLIDIGIDSSDAKKAAREINGELDKTDKKGRAVGETLKKVGAGFVKVAGVITAAATAAFAFTNKITKVGDEIGKTSKKVGASVKDLQRLRFAADRSGASASSLTTALRMQAQFMDQASRGGASEFRAALGAIGVTLEEIQGLGAEERFALMADRLKGIADPAKKSAVAMGLFGARAGAELTPLLLEGGAGIRALGDEAERLGLVMSGDGVKSSEAFQDAITNAKATVQGLFQSIALEGLPTMHALVESFTAWITANRDLIQSGVEKFVKGTIELFRDLAKIIPFVVDNFGNLVALFAGAKLAKAFAGVAAGFKAMGIASAGALGPIGLIAGALIALIPIAMDAGEAIGNAFAIAAGHGTGPRVKKRGATKLIGDLDLDDATKGQLMAQNKATIEASRKLRKLQEDDASSGEIKAQRRMVEGLQKGLATSQAKAANVDRVRRAATAKKNAADTEAGAGIAGLIDFGATLAGAAPGVSAKIAAARKPKRGRGGGGGRRSKPSAAEGAKVSGVTLGDLSLPGVDLDALSAQTPSASEIEPTIAMTIINNSIDFDLAQRIVGGDATSLAGQSAQGVRKAIDAALLAAKRAVQNNVVA